MQLLERTDEVLDIPLDLDELAGQLQSSRTMKDVMTIVRRSARPLVGADGITFVLREGCNCFYADEDAISPLWKGSRFPLSTCVSGLAMLSGETIVIEDIYADPRVPHAAYRPTFVRSLAMVPVGQGEKVAAIGAYWQRRHVPSRQVLDALRGVANAVTSAAPIAQRTCAA